MLDAVRVIECGLRHGEAIRQHHDDVIMLMHCGDEVRRLALPCNRHGREYTYLTMHDSVLWRIQDGAPVSELADIVMDNIENQASD